MIYHSPYACLLILYNDVIDRIMTLLRNSDLHVHVFSSLLGKGVSVLTNRVHEELMAFFYNLYLLGGYAASEKKFNVQSSTCISLYMT